MDVRLKYLKPGAMCKPHHEPNGLKHS